jgi:hypothetical protein
MNIYKYKEILDILDDLDAYWNMKADKYWPEC